MKTKPINVAVLMGGISSEREVSMRSGRAVSEALKKAGYKVSDVIVNDREIPELDNIETDVAFIALHGAFGEDGRVQELLETRRIPYTGSGVSSSRLAMDKAESKKVFNIYNLLTPDYFVVYRDTNVKGEIEFLGLPLVVKPATDGSSVGITIIENIRALEVGLDCASKYSNKVIIERYIKGRELTIGILDDKPLPIVEIKPASYFYDYHSKYKDNNTRYITSVELSPTIYKDIQSLALQAHLALGCRDLSRVDIILGNDGKAYLLEVNTIPGFTERSLLPMAAKAAGIGFVQLCDMLINMAWARKTWIMQGFNCVYKELKPISTRSHLQK